LVAQGWREPWGAAHQPPVPPAGITLTGVGAAATAFLTVFLTSVRDSAPFLDALTTVMSLIALFMTGRKLLESWWVWIVVNLVYIGLYLYKGLVLTAILYAIFAALSVIGLLNWRRLIAEAAGHAPAVTAV